MNLLDEIVDHVSPPTSPQFLLLFPAITEARFFPYLSTPMLTGFLRSQGVSCEQRDLNIMLSRALLSPDNLQRHLEHASLTAVGRRMLTWAVDNNEALVKGAFLKDFSQLDSSAAHRLALNCLDVLLRDSILSTPVESIAEVAQVARRPPGPADTASRCHDALVTRLLSTINPSAVGITVPYFSQLVPSLRLARLIKQLRPETRVVLGGQQVTMRASEISEADGFSQWVDDLVTGPGERVLLDLAIRPEAGRRRVRAHHHHIKDNPPPEFDGLPFGEYLVGDVQLPLVTCVGCYWGRCTYCSYGNRSLKEGYQQMTRTQLLETVRSSLRATAAQRIAFVDENSNIRLLLSVMEELAAETAVIWSVRNRLEPDLADPRFVARMAASGCRLVSVGYETNSQRLLDRVDKGVDSSTYQAIVDTMFDHGIALRLSVMGGLPDETSEEAEASRNFLRRNAAKLGIDAMQMMIIEPTSIEAEREEGPPGPLVNNTGFSFMGGRHGSAPTYFGETREQRREWLGEVARTVHPEQSDERHPRARAGGRSRARSSLRLHRWVVREHRGRQLWDLRWGMRYEIDLDHVRVLDGGDLRAVTESGRALLGVLKEADVGD